MYICRHAYTLTHMILYHDFRYIKGYLNTYKHTNTHTHIHTMKRQWALTTISIDDLNQPSFQVQIQPPTITYNKNTKSQQDLVVKTISPEVNPIKVLDLSKARCNK